MKTANHSINWSKQWMPGGRSMSTNLEQGKSLAICLRRSAHSGVLLSRITLTENETLNWTLIKCRSQCTPEILLWIAREGIKLSRTTLLTTYAPMSFTVENHSSHRDDQFFKQTEREQRHLQFFLFLDRLISRSLIPAISLGNFF